MNKYNIPDKELYSKKQIIQMIDNYQTEKYYSCVDGKYYTAILKDDKLFAKQYPNKKLFYLI